jgi:hypothetical protein
MASGHEGMLRQRRIKVQRRFSSLLCVFFKTVQNLKNQEKRQKEIEYFFLNPNDYCNFATNFTENTWLTIGLKT